MVINHVGKMICRIPVTITKITGKKFETTLTRNLISKYASTIHQKQVKHYNPNSVNFATQTVHPRALNS